MIDFFLFCSEGWRRRRRADQKPAARNGASSGPFLTKEDLHMDRRQKLAARSGGSSGPFLTDEDIPLDKRQRMVDQTQEIYDPDEDF